MKKPRTLSFRSKLLIGLTAAALAVLAVTYTIIVFRPVAEVKIGGGDYHLWIAATDEARIQGLSGIGHLFSNGGLLMDFKADAKWGIWMKDMKIPLDIVWLNKDKQVVYIVVNANPSLGTSKIFYPNQLSRYVLELPAGSVSRDNITNGITAHFSEGGGV